MNYKITYRLLGIAMMLLAVGELRAQNSVTAASEQVNRKMVKLFGIGGFKGLPSYGTGLLVSAKGHILTVNNHILNTPGIVVHLYDGRRYQAKVLIREPELDVALLKIDEDVDFLPHFVFDKAAEKAMAETGDWVLAFSNQFKIAQGDEPMSVQRGAILTVADLKGRRGIFDAPYSGDVYFLDNIVCNPGAAGGAITTRKGELLGIIGRELKDNRIDTWINYAVPIQFKIEVQREDKKTGKSIMEKESVITFVHKALLGNYQETVKIRREDKGGYHGIILVVNAVSSTPPYVEEIVSGSPAAIAGLRPDDLILYVEGFSVPTIKIWRETLKQYEPGREISVQLQRGNKLENVKLKLANPPKTVN